MLDFRLRGSLPGDLEWGEREDLGEEDILTDMLAYAILTTQAVHIYLMSTFFKCQWVILTPRLTPRFMAALKVMMTAQTEFQRPTFVIVFEACWVYRA